MQPLQNVTEYFVRQAGSQNTTYQAQIQQFMKTLPGQKICSLCKEQYDLQKRMPRILVHCGHTFCTSCLQLFFINKRVRCPSCLKLVKRITSIQLLPINHTAYLALSITNQQEQQFQRAQIKEKASKHLYRVYIENHIKIILQGQKQKIDEDSNLPVCVDHQGKIEHFYCVSHQIGLCRQCGDQGHTRTECKVVDLYALKAKMP